MQHISNDKFCKSFELSALKIMKSDFTMGDFNLIHFEKKKNEKS